MEASSVLGEGLSSMLDDTTIIEGLTRCFHLLKVEQRERIRDHLRLGHEVACGKDAFSYVSASGAG